MRVDYLAAHPQLIERVGLLRWREWAYGEQDPTRFVDASRDEAGDGERLPMTLVAIDATGDAVGVVGLGTIDGEVSDAERGGSGAACCQRDKKQPPDLGISTRGWQPVRKR